MDSRITDTADPAGLWRSLKRASEAHGAVVHGAPPEVAIEVGDARLYVTELRAAATPAPGQPARHASCTGASSRAVTT